MIDIIQGDCIDFAKHFRGLTSIVADPPAGIGMMGRKWDANHGGRDEWIRYWSPRFEAARRATESGAHGLFWALPKTAHWTMSALDDAGWEVVDVCVHLFGQGWPKHRNKALKPASEHWILVRNGSGGKLQIDACRVPRGARTAPPGRPWSHYLSGESAAGHHHEVRTDGSFPTNLILSHHEHCESRGHRVVRSGSGTRGIDGNTPVFGGCGGISRKNAGQEVGFASTDGTETIPAFTCLAACDCGESSLCESGGEPAPCPACGASRWWACPVAEVDRQTGHLPGRGNVGATSRSGKTSGLTAVGALGPIDHDEAHWHDKQGGGGSRFFPTFHYFGKCPSSERHAGCEELLWAVDKASPFGFRRIGRSEFEALRQRETDAFIACRRIQLAAEGNVHPTVKRFKLCEWLVRLVTEPGGTTGDITSGSGSIPIAAALAGFQAKAMELSPEAIEIANARAAHWLKHGPAADVRPAARVKPAKSSSVQIDLFYLFGST